MQKNILQKNHTDSQKFYQLKLSLNIDYMIPVHDSVHLLNQFVGEMDLANLYSPYSRIKGNQVSPKTLLKIMIYNTKNDYSTCQNDKHLKVVGTKIRKKL